MIGSNPLQRIAHLQELESLLVSLDIDKEDICLVGSVSLALAGIRQNRDIDICLSPSVRKRLLSDAPPGLTVLPTGTLMLSPDVQSGLNRYEQLGISENDLLTDQQYFSTIDGFKVVRPELEFSLKNCRQLEKDIEDLKLLEEYAFQSPDWDWGLVRDPVHGKQARRRRRSAMGTLRRAAGRLKRKAIGTPRSIAHIPRRVWQRWAEIQDRLKIAAMVETGPICLTFPTLKLAARQYSGHEYNRMDVIVRYMAIEEYMGQAKGGFALYKKMQRARVGHRDIQKDFEALIDSVSAQGFDGESAIEIDPEGRLVDGSHRLATALYFGVPQVPVKVQPRRCHVDYSARWFQAAGFTQEELARIEGKRVELFERLGLMFVVILWSPASPFFDEIEADMGRLFRVVGSEDLSIQEEEFPNAVRCIYGVDDVVRWKVERKLHALQPYPKRLRLIRLEIPDPAYRKKAINNHDISDVGAKLKARYRQMFSARIPNYIFDIIIHTGDNYEHNARIADVIHQIIKTCSTLPSPGKAN